MVIIARPGNWDKESVLLQSLYSTCVQYISHSTRDVSAIYTSVMVVRLVVSCVPTTAWHWSPGGSHAQASVMTMV